MIAVINYGMGNLRSVQKGLERVGLDARITDSPSDLADSAGIVLPGVGAFAAAMENLRGGGLADALTREIEKGKPYLGICLGLQLLFSWGDEGKGAEGLGLIPGRVELFAPGVKVPHMGWNQVKIVNRAPIFDGIEDESFFYFVHSYIVKPESGETVAARTEYGENFVCAVVRDNISATQFHPEKSQKTGLKMIENFGRLCR